MLKPWLSGIKYETLVLFHAISRGGCFCHFSLYLKKEKKNSFYILIIIIILIFGLEGRLLELAWSDWVEWFFLPNLPWWILKNPNHRKGSIQSNSTYMDRVESMGWIDFFFLITIINIKLRIRTIPLQIRAKLWPNNPEYDTSYMKRI